MCIGHPTSIGCRWSCIELCNHTASHCFRLVQLPECVVRIRSRRLQKEFQITCDWMFAKASLGGKEYFLKPPDSIPSACSPVVCAGPFFCCAGDIQCSMGQSDHLSIVAQTVRLKRQFVEGLE